MRGLIRFMMDPTCTPSSSSSLRLHLIGLLLIRWVEELASNQAPEGSENYKPMDINKLINNEGLFTNDQLEHQLQSLEWIKVDILLVGRDLQITINNVSSFIGFGVWRRNDSLNHEVLEVQMGYFYLCCLVLRSCVRAAQLKSC